MKKEIALAASAAGLLRLLFTTIRLKVDDRLGLGDNTHREPLIICFWHNRILGISLSFLRRYPHGQRGGVTVLTSPSRDGEILARVVGHLGMGAVRGSSSRRGSRALREMVRIIEQRGDVAITPDGPRGPRYRLGPGAILLAQTTGAGLALMHARYSRCVRMKSWDRFIVPLPFSTISIRVDPVIYVPRELDAEAFEAARMRVEAQLKEDAD